MLSYRPSDRYGSAAEVARSLRVLYPNSGSSTPASSTSGNISPSTPDLSQMRTVAVGRPPGGLQSPAGGAPDPTETKIPEPVENSILDSPLAIFIIVLTVALVVGFSSWAIVSFWRQSLTTQPQTITPQNFPSPLVSDTPTPIESAIPKDEEPVSKSLRFDIRDTAVVNGTIKANETIEYTFFGQEDQDLTTSINENADVVMTVLGPNREPMDAGSVRVVLYQGKLPFNGKYIIQLNTAEGVTESSYQLKVRLEKPVKATPPEQPIIENIPEESTLEDTPEQTPAEELPEEPTTENIPEEPTTENIPEEPAPEESPEQFPSDQPAENPSSPINPEPDPVNPETETEQQPADEPVPIDDGQFDQ